MSKSHTFRAFSAESEGLTTYETNRDPRGPHFDSARQRILGASAPTDKFYRLAFEP